MTTTKKETDMETPIVSDNQDDVHKQELEESKAKENPLPKKGDPGYDKFMKEHMKAAASNMLWDDLD